MREELKDVLVISLAMALFSAIVFAEEPSGEALYKKNCAACHGEDGKGKPALAKMFKIEEEKLDLTTSDVKNDSDEELLKVINDGINKMPAYKDKLTQEEQQELLKYIRATELSPQ